MDKFPIIVTYPMSQIELQPVKEYLESKGYETKVVKHNAKNKKRMTEELFVLLRGISKEEEKEIAEGKWSVKNHSFNKRVYNNLSKVKVDCVCPRCGKEFTGYDCLKRTFCERCKKLAAFIGG